MTREKMLDNIAYEITRDMKNYWENYQKAKIFINWYFEGDDIETIEPYYWNKRWKEALKINYEDWKEGN